MSHYRIILDIEKFNFLREQLEENASRLTYEQHRRFYYEQGLFFISILDYDKAELLLSSWSLRSMDYKGALWKSCILVEVGRKRDAEVLIREMLKIIKKNILNDSYSSELVSARSAMEFLSWKINLLQTEKPVANNDFDFWGVLNEYHFSILNYLERQKKKETPGSAHM